ncbi:MAG: magnesium transporter [Verrucomicrobia bacterium]|nr:magnesium transporter [Verrucomicrobiota bacterium]
MRQLEDFYIAQLQDKHPADIADILQRLPVDEAYPILSQLSHSKAAFTLAEMEKDRLVEFLEILEPTFLASVLQEIPPNEAADLIGELPTSKWRPVLKSLAPEKAAPIRDLLKYPEDSAGGIMTDRFISLNENETVLQSQKRLRGRVELKSEDVSYLYVTNNALNLVGVVSFRDLLFSPPQKSIREIMNPNIKFVRVFDDQEEIARHFQHYHYLGLPVLDRKNQLVGVVKASEVLRVAQEEATEDMQLMVGLSGEERALTPWTKSIRRRLPWLFINLITAFMAAAVIGIFENTIAQWTALAVFLPIIAGQGGNAGMQTLTIVIRDMALGEINPGDGRKALLKELLLSIANGIAIGIVVGIIGYLWKDSFHLGIVAGAAMLLNMVAASLSGVLIPLGLKFFKVDPAMASSIFLTTVTDVAGFFFFLGLGTLALKFFVL